MTEEEWLACENIQRMLKLIDGRVSYRQLRLFVCACCRLIWDERWPHRTRRAIEVAERFADGMVDSASLNNARSEACRISQDWHERSNHLSFEDPQRMKTRLLHFATIATEPIVSMHSLMVAAPWHDARLQPVAAELLRCIFRYRTNSSADALQNGSEPSSPLVTEIALAAHEGRQLPTGHLDTARLAVLSDALEESGCTDAAILEHLRSPGPHVRGCWALDLILGKS